MVGDPNDSAARAELVAALEGLAPAFEPYDSAEGATKLADWVAQPRERRLDLTGQDEALPTGIRWSAKQCQVDYAGYLPDDALDALADDLWAGLNADWFYAARPEDDPSHPLHETCLASDAYQEYLRSIEAGEVKADYVYLRMLLTDLLPYVEADGDDGVIESIERLIEAIDVVQAGGTGQATQEDLDQPVLWGATKGCSLS
jgi:hypothetical protein